jgi:hypothetical protein
MPAVSLSRRCPERKDVPSFLVEVTTAAGQELYGSKELKADAARRAGGQQAGQAADLLLPYQDIEERFWREDPAGVAMARCGAACSAARGCHQESMAVVVLAVVVLAVVEHGSCSAGSCRAWQL